MISKFLILVLALSFNIKALYATEINVDVNGLVCEFCAVTIEKSFRKKSEVDIVKVDLEKKKLFITFKEDQDLPDEVITDIVKNNGYHVVKINRK